MEILERPGAVDREKGAGNQGMVDQVGGGQHPLTGEMTKTAIPDYKITDGHRQNLYLKRLEWGEQKL